MSSENDTRITEQIIWSQIENAAGKTKRQLQIAIDSVENKLVNGKTNKTITFEDFGCDAFFVDEAHRYKNLFSSTLSRETGMNDGRQSAKALSVFKKTQFIREQNNRKNVFFFTATPLTNSPLEYYNMLINIAPEELQSLQITNINMFIKNFAAIELGWKNDWTNGQVKQGKILTGFKNVRTLQDIFFKYTDFQNDPAKINLIKPKANNHPNIIAVNEEQMITIKKISS